MNIFLVVLSVGLAVMFSFACLQIALFKVAFGQWPLTLRLSNAVQTRESRRRLDDGGCQ